MKKAIIGSLLIVGLTAGVAFSHGKGHGFRGGGYQMGGGGGHQMMGSGMMGYQHGGGGWGNFDCPRVGMAGGGWNSTQKQNFLDETVELRKQMHEKRFEIREARRSSNLDVEKLGQLEKDMIDIRSKIQKKAQKLAGAAGQQ